MNGEKPMNEVHTIDLPDIADQNAVRQFFGAIQNPETNYLRVRDGANYFLVYHPTENEAKEKNGKVSEEVTQRRLASLKRIEALSKEVAELWCTDETAVEAVANCRR